MSGSDVRWWNRLADRMWPWIGQPLFDACVPVWKEGASEPDESEDEAERALLDEVYWQGCADGYREARQDFGL